MDIAFWYLPEEDLIDEATVQEAEAAQKYFMFIDSRRSYDFDKVLSQFGGSRTDLTGDKYFVSSSATEMIIWEENDNVFRLYFPTEITIASDSPEAYCELQTILLKGSPPSEQA